MTRILIIGAHGQIARVATELFLQRQDVELTLYLRRPERLAALAADPRVTRVEGDATDLQALLDVMPGHDVVYANLSGAMGRQARAIVTAMQRSGVRRLIFVSAMGIYGEVPGERYHRVLDPYREAAEVVEASELDYTVLRPAWLDNQPTVAYGLTRKGEPFKAAGATVSRRSVADLVVRLATTAALHLRESLGVHRA